MFNYFFRYTVDLDLKKVFTENSVDKENIIETKKNVKKLFEEKYLNQSTKSDKKAQAVQYFFNKLKF
jgi:large subunit ribosomal protein L27e